KQRQVLKSLMTLTMIKKTRVEGVYHNPLMITLVNSVNTEDSDLLMFFEKLEEIAIGQVDRDLFIEAKEELIKDFQDEKYMFGEEKFDFKRSFLDNIDLEDILNNVFNTRN